MDVNERENGRVFIKLSDKQAHHSEVAKDSVFQIFLYGTEI